MNCIRLIMQTSPLDKSDTHWACRYFAVEVVSSTCGATLEAIIDGNYQLKQRVFCKNQIFQILGHITFILAYIIVYKRVSDHLQSPQTNPTQKHVTLLVPP